MCLTLFTSMVVWTLDKFEKIRTRTAIVLADPGVFIAGSLAGGVARAVMIPLDPGRAGPIQSVYRKAPQWGLLIWIYLPLASKMAGSKEKPTEKLTAIIGSGFTAGIMMRLLSNPFTAIRENIVAGDALRGNFRASFSHLYKEKGLAGLYMRQHPIFVSGVLYSITFTFFEAIRNFVDNNGAPTENPVSNAAVNMAVGAVASAAGCAMSFPISKNKYDATMIRETAVTRGLTKALLKEVPQFTVFIGAFSLLMPIFSPSHGTKCGFGGQG